MRTLVILGSATMLAACGGDTGAQSAGSVAPPTGPAATHSFVNPTETKTYEGLGGVQSYDYSTRSDQGYQDGQLYAADANTARSSGISVAYNPRDAIFELTISQPLGNVEVAAFRFQDPQHRTDFDGAVGPQAGVPEFAANKQIQYLQADAATDTGSALSGNDPLADGAERSDYFVGAAGSSSTVNTLFYQKPGTTTKYVTYAGFVRNVLSANEVSEDGAPPALQQNYGLDRAAFVFGERTANGAVPKTGSASFTGDMIASMVFNPMGDTDPGFPSYLQWIEGSNTTSVDFASLAVTTELTGTVHAPTLDAYTSWASALPAGSRFAASATATLDLINKGGFTGSFDKASFTRPGMDDFTVSIAGSSLDGAFFGPNGEEIGAGFRIVGGTPDERIDIVGAFTGKK
ncbi:transferrin-binding protein-like solute binding protein [Sphingomonas japonica]|uniref:Transferrin-binding protein B C-lobe/N-lobe beta-barrel domain-containing protein n=1 Tax=Sphingomonas japonica TaxID=511662 RepID=A0ABX0U5F8_9SPHN|nr:transferrin-binding protein-like solute binding protein [Sphingomonas japonica]NIJ24492.1 hypothetical protein [Sphingomonas japonica]